MTSHSLNLIKMQRNSFSLHLISSSLSLLTHIFNINYIYSLLFLIQFLIHPNISQSTTEAQEDDPNNDGQYTSIYLTMYVNIKYFLRFCEYLI